MTLENKISQVFGLDDEGWARHANPWSGWTRFITCLPLLALAIWSRVWLGWWALVPIGLALLWIWANPKAFGPAKSDDAWISKGVLGERFWSSRSTMEIPERHRILPHLLNLVALAGLPFLVWGLVALQIWPTAVGVALIIGGKLWYIDRMAILYGDIVERSPELRYRGAPRT
ncbi:DUF6653 family protein [Qipengyuania qiaonensis]|uniref:Uncharacterized protein n=1 Tax=Qipengyuania qiaonensis TaxID=2867240 RepID=A0ABS7J6W8_9SPHN|nr:DUF6653 family protein [Qipengyuania qiaonensis]MBX7481619.1 hypothetical protein [Qipengyuania qiaonensis]